MLHYDTRGTGPELTLLVHGFLGSGRNLATLGRQLVEAQPQRTVVLPDLRGHGQSPALGDSATLSTLAEDLLALADKLAPAQRVHIVGHSLGGRVALTAWHMAPHRVHRCTLLDISPDPVGVLHGNMQRVFERLMGAPAQAESRAAMRTFFGEGHVPGPLTDWILTNFVAQPDGSFAWRIDRAGLAQLHWNEAGVDLWPLLPARAPQLEVLWGGASTFVGEASQQRLRALGAGVHELPGASHFVHVEAADAIVAHLGQAAPQ